MFDFKYNSHQLNRKLVEKDKADKNVTKMFSFPNFCMTASMIRPGAPSLAKSSDIIKIFKGRGYEMRIMKYSVYTIT